MKQMAPHQNQLQKTFEAPYAREAWTHLLRTLFSSSAELFITPIPIAYAGFDGVFTRVLHLGDLKTADNKVAALLDIEVAPRISLTRNRAGIRHLAAKLVDGVQRQGILAAFHGAESPDWRFSFIIREKTYVLETGETLTTETPARRFTYLLGPGEKCRTAVERFASLKGTASTLGDIEAAFKVDLLTKEFYSELSDWYFWALTRVRFPDDAEKNDEKRNATMTIRLVTRLIFVWFLKKKGIVPECLFDKAVVEGWLNNSDCTGSTYYKAVLQNLFFATLNFDPREGQPGFVEWGRKGVLGYRYLRFFKRGAAEKFLDVCKDIPFLNGGLFENLDKHVETPNPIRIDCFSNLKENEPRLAVPDDLFFSAEQVVDLSAFYDDKRKAAVKVKGLFEILNAYNFTVEENTPFDKDVALDPELLGQVFENLLASYNPETRTTARKQTGSFYTPREIVQYMVDESIKAYLLTAMEKVGQAHNVGQAQNVGQAFLPAENAQTGMSAPQPPSSIHISRRRLPHWHRDGAIYWVCFRLADSIPLDKLRTWQADRTLWCQSNPDPWNERQWQEYNRLFGDRYEAWLDAGTGSRALAREDVRSAVADCLMRFHGDRLLIHAAVVMPTHVHALIEPLPVNNTEGEAGISACPRKAADKNVCATLPQCEAGIPACPGFTDKNVCATLPQCEAGIPACPGFTDKNVCATFQCGAGIPACQRNADKNVCATATLPCHDLSALLQGIKGASARAANKILGTTGKPFWMDESYDHIVRSEEQYRHFVRYVQENPVKASLRSDEYWLAVNAGQAFLPAQDAQTGMSAPRSAPPSPNVGQAFLPANAPQPLSQRIAALLSPDDQDVPFTDTERRTLVEALYRLKILDPACGSGAFPMGVLQQLVHILNRLDPDNRHLKAEAIQQVREEVGSLGDDSADVDDKMEKMQEMLRLFDETATRPDYARKLLLIERGIYGVDIQPVAVQIAKLRFFISLVVEQNAQEKIRPLPNLETNFV
ncbi:MAG: SAM-dependent DNA methyltransferase, partial [Lentisphaerae bacterium]|nr:SAM-dependent DNA methyltransferase [Lentisphaerota bacterium]